jgi:dCTP deaminase
MVQPSSVDVRLDRFFRLFDNHKYQHIDPATDQPDLTRLVEVDSQEAFVLHPGEFVLGATFEVVTLPDDVAARLEGKSSLGRLGLLTHSTAGFIDPGFSGHVTLELSNVATLPITLWPGMKIGQLCFFRLSSAAEHPYGSEKYGSRYQGQRGPTASRSFQNFHRSDTSGAAIWSTNQGLKAKGVCSTPERTASGATHFHSHTSDCAGEGSIDVVAINTGQTSFSTMPEASTAR